MTIRVTAERRMAASQQARRAAAGRDPRRVVVGDATASVAEPPRWVRSRLGSGLTVIVATVPHASRVVMNAQLHTGSRFETRNNNGISHFLEHMLFRGTASHPTAHDQALAFESLGGTLVASTAADVGELAIAVPPESFKAVVPLFAEAFMQPTFSDIDVERGIVAEEIRESLDDKGVDVDPDNRIRALVFADHSLGYPITGGLRDLEGFTRARLRARHQAHYTSASTVLTVVGPVESKPVVRQLGRAFASLRSGKRPLPKAPADQRAARFSFVRHQSSQTALRVGFRAPGYSHPDEPALELLVRILDDGMAARLYSSLCDAQGLCYDVAAGYEAYQDAGLLELSAECTHDHAERVLEELLGIMQQLRHQGPSADELARAKQRHEWQLRDTLHDASELAAFLAHAHLAGEPLSVEARRRQLDRVTADQLTRAAQHWLAPEHLSTLVVGMQGKRAQARLQGLAGAYR